MDVDKDENRRRLECSPLVRSGLVGRVFLAHRIGGQPLVYAR